MNTKIETIKIHTDYITLGAFLKYTGIIENGAMAKVYLTDHSPLINGESDSRRGRKLYPTDKIEVEDRTFVIENER